ncbi:MAG TPA: 7-cyano-7-deazaguanine synthase [Rhizomicrobium sp.]|jgi:7-cyano-7-deazaguanine synthase
MNTGILLASGGLDSTTLAYWLKKCRVSFVPVFFDYGQHCVEKEWTTLQGVLPPGLPHPKRVDISDVFANSCSRLIKEADLWTETITDNDLYLPYRTLLFFSVAVSIAQSMNLGEVYSGFINSNHAKELDCSADFLNSLEALAAHVGPVRIHLPFREKSKTDVTRLAVQLGVPIGTTFSCQVFSNTPCGACPNCVERLNAIANMEAEL